MYQLGIKLGQAGLAGIVEDEHGVDHCVAVVAVLDAPVALHAGAGRSARRRWPKRKLSRPTPGAASDLRINNTFH
jgi:hypothetical protein